VLVGGGERVFVVKTGTLIFPLVPQRILRGGGPNGVGTEGGGSDREKRILEWFGGEKKDS